MPTRLEAGGEDGDNNLSASMTEFFAQFLGNQRAIQEAMCNIAQNIAHLYQHRQGSEPNQHSSFKEFLDTKPPIFKEAEEPLQADDWLNTIEQKFRLLRVTDQWKAEYASHQLQGPARIWWTNYLSTLPAGANVSWDQFKTAFRGHHILPGLMMIKAEEFLKLTQGTKTVTEYMHAFNNLSRYAPEFVNSEENKIFWFKRGLSTKLLKTMGNSKCATYNEFVSDAITQEYYNNLHATAKNRKRAYEAISSQQRALPAPKAQCRPPAQQYRPIALPKGNAGQGSSGTPKNNLPCFNCYKPGHFARNCPYPQAGPNAHQGHVHYIAVEKTPEGEPVIVDGMVYHGYCKNCSSPTVDEE